MTNNLKHNINYREKVKFLVLLIITFFCIAGMTSNISQDYTNYKNLHHNKENLVSLNNPSDTFILSQHTQSNINYYIGLGFLAFVIFVLTQQIFKDYRLLRGTKQ